MKTSKDDTEAEGQRLLAPLADKLARTGSDERRRLVEQLLPNATPTILRLLVELLVRKLESRSPKMSTGAEEALVLLGAPVLPTLESALRNKPSEARLLRLAPLVGLLGKSLPQYDRAKLEMTLMIAAHRAPSSKSAGALWAAIGYLRDQPGVPFELFSAALAAQTPTGTLESQAVDGSALGSQPGHLK